MEVTFEAKNGGTTVSVSCKNIPPGVRPEDNEAGTQQTLEKLARYIEREHSMQKITTFFMFDGQAEEAMNYYLSVFDQAEILSINRYGANEAGAEGSVPHATFSLYGQVFMCIDSNVKHNFTFTPSISWYIACTTEDEIDRLFEKLSQGGKVLMPLASYPFSEKFGWIVDKYGVSWQLNLERN